MSERLSAYETYLRSGQDMLRVAFPYKTDGVGGHVVTATSALGGAALRGLRSVCDAVSRASHMLAGQYLLAPHRACLFASGRGLPPTRQH